VDFAWSVFDSSVGAASRRFFFRGIGILPMMAVRHGQDARATFFAQRRIV